VFAPVTTTSTRTMTHEGGAGWERDPKSALFLLAVTNMVSENTFYETGEDRDDRFASLIHQVTVEDPEWVAKLVPYLRDTMHMRSASLVAAAEYVKAGGPNGRQVITAALKRPDEPAEMLGYWMQTHGRKLPQPIKRGVADALERLYTERNVLRYDGTGKAWRFGDVVELVHPKPTSPERAALYKYLIDSRHNRDDLNLELLPTLTEDRRLQAIPESERREALPNAIEAGWSWERLSGWLPGGMDAAAWEAVIPNMGYMALLRNLRNFDTAGISDETAATVAVRLANPEEIAKSKQFPFRFLSAWREIGSLRWAHALEKALDASLVNVPHLDGRTLVMVDLSGSMWSQLSGRSRRERWEVALIFGAALAKRANAADLVVYGTQAFGVPFDRPLLKVLEEYGRSLGGTNTFGTLNAAYNNHDRVIIVTDEQAHDAGQTVNVNAPIYTFNVAGYAPAHNQSGSNGRYTFGGLTDAGFSLIPIIDAQRDGTWPHLI
jgi:hypothetical protein